MAFSRSLQLSRSLRSLTTSSPSPASLAPSNPFARSGPSLRHLSTRLQARPTILSRQSALRSSSIRSASTFTSNHSGSSGGSSSFRSQLLKPTSIVLIFVPIVCVFLGVWQVKRLRWKVALIEEVDRNLHKDPLVLPANIKCVFFYI